MPSATYTPLANITLGSSAASVTFSSISQAYRDLILVVNGTSTADTGDGYMRFNSDTGANYSRVAMYGLGSGSPASFTSADFGGPIMRTSQTMSIFQIMDYSATDKHKTVLGRLDAASFVSFAYAGRWASTAAVTTIVLGPTGVSFAAGTNLSLYGVAA